MRLMADERISSQHDNVTIGTLATKLRDPEYRLRRLINQQLGYRNFNVLSSTITGSRRPRPRSPIPSQAEVPVITIAMDAGFQSLGPFNRAFKATTGVTPSEYRRLNDSRVNNYQVIVIYCYFRIARAAVRFRRGRFPESGERRAA